MTNPKDLYIITTARKRDTCDWEDELAPFLLSTHKALSKWDVNVVVDSWNNIAKYIDRSDSFFIFDEQRVVGSGSWVKSFLKITKKNRWILLSATPGDTWMDYVPVFLANGFYKNRSEFLRRHVVYNQFTKFPKVERYLQTRILSKLRDKITVVMPDPRRTKRHVRDILVRYDEKTYDQIVKLRWNPFEEEPIDDISSACFCMRRLVNSDKSRQKAVLHILERHPKAIVFYNFDYELFDLRALCEENHICYSEWNGHRHQPIPTGDSWVYLVQYTAGAEGWNCVTTDTVIFYSLNYSYKAMEQASGRIDRMNTPFIDLYYYRLRSESSIDSSILKCLNNKKRFNERTFAQVIGIV